MGAVKLRLNRRVWLAGERGHLWIAGERLPLENIREVVLGLTGEKASLDNRAEDVLE